MELPRPSRWTGPARPHSEGLRTTDTRASHFPRHPASENQPTLSSGSYFTDLLRNGLRRIADASWRRRFLLLTPVLAMIPLSILAALVLPRSYETSALLLLQETGRNNPFAGEAVSPEFMQQKVPGLEALLKSEQVLAPAIGEMEAAGLKSQGDLQAGIRNFRSALSVELVGTDFLTIRLKGSKSEGLGRQLSIVLSSFLQALLSESSGNAAQVVLSKQQQQISLLEQKKAVVQRQLAGTAAAGAGGGTGGDLQRQLAQVEQQLVSARETYDSLARRYPQTNPGLAPGILNAPGRIKIVDAPEDPSFSTSSRAKILLGGIAAGLLLGIALAWAAELLDPTIYDRDELVSATGLPLLAVLRRAPRLSGSAPPAKAPMPKSRRRVALPLVAVAVILGVLFLLALGIPTQLQIPNWLKFSNPALSQATSLVQH
jgi:capsular polysaccharide biosynthesis protein